jgi:hypothetical protein
MPAIRLMRQGTPYENITQPEVVVMTLRKLGHNKSGPAEARPPSQSQLGTRSRVCAQSARSAIARTGEATRRACA